MLIFLYSSQANAVLEKTAYEKYNMEQRLADTVKVTVITTRENIDVACAKAAKQQGFKPLTYKVQACTFWKKTLLEGRTCTMIIPAMANNNNLGHEIRRCFVGEFH